MAGIYFDATYKNVILRDKPSVYWPLNQTNGATDQSGNARNGVAGAGVSIGGLAGNSPITDENTCTQFDGSDDFINVAAYVPYVNAVARTFVAWVNISAFLANNNVWGDDNAQVGTLWGSGDSTFYFKPSGASYVSWPSVVTTGWHYIALLFDESTDIATFYIDGVSQGDKTQTATWTGATGLRVGGGGFLPFLGNMAHVAVFEYALHADRILAHYTAATA